MRFSRQNVRRVQLVFLVLMAASATQVLWWVLDQARHTRELHDRLRQAWAADQWAAVQLLDAGTPETQVAERYPHLDLEARPIGVRAEVLDALDARRQSRLRQYGWEGSFFLLVLISGMAVVWRAVRQDAELRLRQRNFLAAVSHEFKSPIASMQLTAETIALRDPPRERRQTLVRRLLADLDRLGGLVSNLLETSSLEQGAAPSAPEPLVLRSIAAEVVAEVADRAREAGIEIEVRIAEDLRIEADRVAATSVLRNLVDNSLKAIEPRGHGRIRLIGEARDRKVRLSVHDDGVGFVPAEAPRLFEQFYRSGDEMRRSTPGTGLGLHIVRHLVRRDGGRVEAHSDGPGLGATLVVEWRRPNPAAAEASPRMVQDERPASESASAPGTGLATGPETDP